MIRGIKFCIPNGHKKILAIITMDLEVSKYYWLNIESEDQAFKINIGIGSEFLFDTDSYEGNAFETKILVENYYVIFVKLQAYLVKDDLIEIKSYNEFLKSNCEIMIYITDGIFVEVYAKNIKIIEAIRLNAQNNQFLKIEYNTEGNDIQNLD